MFWLMGSVSTDQTKRRFRIVFDERERFGEWARARIPHVHSWGEWYQAIGLERDGEIVAACIFNLYSTSDIAMHIASIPGGRWMTKSYLRAVFEYPFLQLGVRRVTGYVPAKNFAAQRFDEHIGFTLEGLMREALPDDDVLLYGMLKRECRWV